jgi:UDP-2,4-diacetamido-2,4,6-trideoxy-beta-L-altropyranose hydrolase
LENPGHLIIGAECGVKIGTGHVMRCLALAQSWRRFGGRATFLVPGGSPGIGRRIESEGFSCESLTTEGFTQNVVDRMLSSKPTVAVLDGYGFGCPEQSALHEAGSPTLIVDDYGHATEYPARWILNHNAFATEEPYARRGKDSVLLLGSRYALIREEFLQWLAWKREIPARAERILITIGGSDPDNLSLRIVEALGAARIPHLEIILVVGSSNPHLPALRVAVERSALPIKIEQNVSDMPALMAWADVGISGAGGTSYELCYMGLPALLFVISENQRQVAAKLSGFGAAIHAGWAGEFNESKFVEELGALIESQEKRQGISGRARSLVDGLGADRVRAALLDKQITMRRAHADDCQLLFSWASDPITRSASFRSSELLWEDHQEWFSQRLQDPQTVIYIGEGSSGNALGQTRFQLGCDRATVSIVVAPEFRGVGWGRELIALSVRTLAREYLVRHVDAFIKPGNQTSIRMFESAGFTLAGNREIADQPALLFTWEAGKVAYAG